MVANAVKLPVCSWAALGKALLHWAHGGPFQQMGRSPALTKPSDRGRIAALCSCLTLGISCVTEEVLCGTDSDSRERQPGMAP